MLQDLLGHRQRDRGPVTEEYAISFTSAPSSSRTLDLVLVAIKMRTSSGKRDAFRFGLLVEDRHLGFEVGRLDVHHQAPLEARAQAFHQAGRIIGRRIARDDDLLLVLVELVEGVEEFFLRALLAGEDLNIVDQQHVRRAIVPMKQRHTVES